VLAGIGVVLWIVFCASLTLVIGSGAERYPVDQEADLNETMLLAGVVCFLFASLASLVLKATGKGQHPQESSGGVGLVFLVVTPLVALVAGIVIDIAN
jgi:hypothetical protein